MSLTIGRLLTRASIPRRLRSLAPAVDDAARREFRRALARARAAHATGRAVCRIRQLRVRLKVTPDDVRRAKLADLWAEAFTRALKVAVADGGGVEILTAESRADWIAQFMIRLLDGDAVDGWAYEEFSGVASLPAGEALAALLEENAAEASEVLAILDARQRLGRALAALSAGQTARILGVLDRGDPPSSRTLSLDDLLAAGALLLEVARAPSDDDSWTRGASSLDARAIRLFAVQRRLGTSPARLHLSAARIRDALPVIGRLGGLRLVLPPNASAQTIAGVLAQLRRGEAVAIDVPAAGAAAGAAAAGAAALSGGASEADLEAARTLGSLLDRVVAAMPSMGVEALRQLAARWIDSDLASVLLLVPVVLRLGWPQRIRTSRSWNEHGPRALTYALAGVALAIAGRPPEPAGADPALLLFAGWTGEPDVRGFRHWMETTSADDRRDLLVSLLADREAAQAPDDWETSFHALAHALVRRFVASLRGFQRSSDRFVVERFLSTPGRMLIEPARVLVSLDLNPLWVAVHLAGGDSPVDSAGWLGDRRVEFELGGL